MHVARDGVRLEYYLSVLDTLRRYIRDGHEFALTTEVEADCTEVSFAFDTASFSPYMEHLEPSLNEQLVER